MRIIKTRSFSFPVVPFNNPLDALDGKRWQVLCGDKDHWRVGFYSPDKICAEEIIELEHHTCPELFILLHGRVTLLLAEGGSLRELELEPSRPVLVTAPHSGFCPDGPKTGMALVVERDAFDTEYQRTKEWLTE